MNNGLNSPIMRFLVNVPKTRSPQTKFPYSINSLSEILLYIYIYHCVPRNYTTNSLADGMLLHERDFWHNSQERSRLISPVLE